APHTRGSTLCDAPAARCDLDIGDRGAHAVPLGAGRPTATPDGAGPGLHRRPARGDGGAVFRPAAKVGVRPVDRPAPGTAALGRHDRVRAVVELGGAGAHA